MGRFDALPDQTLTFGMVQSRGLVKWLAISALYASFLYAGVGVAAEASKKAKASAQFSQTGLMTSARSLHTANLLVNGKVLIAGGVGAGGESAPTLASAEIFDPRLNAFSPTGSMSTPRLGAASVRLRNGSVFVAGGEDSSKKSVSSVELYDPKKGSWATTAAMFVDRVNP